MSNLYANYLKRLQDTKQKINDLKFTKEIKENSKDKDDNFDVELFEKSIAENKLAVDSIADTLTSNLNSQLKQMDSDKAIKLLEWINTWEFYLDTEDSFDLTKRRTYKRGDIVHVNFGFNVHNELGGTHYAIVVEGNNAQTNGTVVVVPLKSTEEDNPTNLDNTEVFLGKCIIPIGKAKNKNTIAKVGQLKSISKLRILKPTNDKQSIYPVDSDIRNDILNKLDQKIKELYMKYENTIDTK
ncbi:type II toxin-antitoxin system PemK/MazF family toxin [Clostridium sp. C8]|uniref:type II toxin-antitoxin system PemK/MazF family toxin n=1 Tax=Clostridium sp. C8 TaxID=1667357 RepID=UPI00069B0F3B|nr:type II toxin-antitoxin system PemK/MazF family toxin [Clostridium sp. C8]